jgi:putative copper export protein
MEVMSTPFGVDSPVYVAVRLLQYLAFSLWAGSVSASLSWCRDSAPSGKPGFGVSRASLERLLRVALVLLVLSLVLRLWAQAHAFDDATLWPQPEMVTTMLRKTLWGRAWLVEAFALGVGALVAWKLRSGDGQLRAWYVGAGVAFVIAVSFALSGHAASSETLQPLAVVADALHASAAGTWVGGIVVLAMLLLPSTRRTAEPIRGDMLATAIIRFSKVALVAVSLIVVTGAFAAWLHIGSVSALFDSSYGRTLGVKLLVLTPMLLAGLANWRWITPRLRMDQRATGGLTRSVRVELVFGLLVLLLTAILVATPTPAEG